MMPSERFERQLPELLTELAAPRTPDYFDDLFGLTARTRQRPAWTFFERWLPMVDIARQPILTSRVPLRTIGLGLLLVALILAAVAAFVVGTQRNLPAPFGLARNGLVAFARDGDIYVADPIRGTEHLVVAGPDTDVRPEWSLDGTRLAFERKEAGRANLGRLYVAMADGTELTPLTPEPLSEIRTYAFSPDGRRMLISTWVEGIQLTYVAQSDGSAVRTLNTSLRTEGPTWRPPDGAEILFSGEGNFDGTGLYVSDSGSGEVRTILEPSAGRYRANARWSPDGTKIAYTEWVDADVQTARTHVMSADGTGDLLLALPPGAVWEALNDWSNDGTRLVNVRGYTDLHEDVRVVVVPADGSNFGIEIDYPGSIQGECCSSWEWAPDDLSILGTPADSSGQTLQQVMLDPATGTSMTVPWTTDSYPAWQRIGP